jgi:energy-coupling factor transporter ATP-binding protein EcfA2
MDLAARRSLAAAVRSLTERGAAVVFATHDTDLVAAVADRTIALDGGRAVEVEVEADTRFDSALEAPGMAEMAGVEAAR